MVDLESNAFLFKEGKAEAIRMGVKAEKKNEYSSDRSRERKNPHPSRKNPHHEDAILGGGRSNKQLAVYTKSTVSLEMVDTVFLNCGQGESPLCETLQRGTTKNVQQHGQSKGANGRKGCGVDLRTLLTLCARQHQIAYGFQWGLPLSTSLV